MDDLAVVSEFAVIAAQKHAALEAILHSQTFARADQLKSFLKFVCEMELAGRGHELTEYLIGVEALGRSPNYSPGDDSAVRNRAFALRKKLQEYYEHEQPDELWRIELTKGSYCPHFVENTPPALPESAAPEGTESPLEPPVAESLPLTAPVALPQWKGLLVAFLLGVIGTALCAWGLYFLTHTKSVIESSTLAVAPVLSEAWGPLLAPNADVMICIANPSMLAVHAPQDMSGDDPNMFLTASDLGHWIKEKFRLTTEQRPLLSVTTNGTYWGDSLGAMAALKTLATVGHSAHVFPEKVTTISTLRHRNVVLFGAPEYSPAIAHFLEKCPLTVNYLSAVVSRESENQAAQHFPLRRDAQFRAIELYGLITVLPSESSTSEQYRTIIFSGVNSAGAQAAAEFFSSPSHLLELQKKMKLEGHDHFPPAYQVVVKAEPDDNLLLSFKYETHRVISTPTGH